jgi:hypothetical protein
MRNVLLIALVWSFFVVSPAWAKRGAPKPVAAVKAEGIEYRVPHEHMGCVEAWDTEHNELLWRRQIYVVKFTPGLERDVQDVFIVSVEVTDEGLRVKNERQSEYALDLKTLAITTKSGALVEQQK